jgi:hypothetical protein
MEFPKPTEGHSMALVELAAAHERRRRGALRLRAALAREVEHETEVRRLRARLGLLRAVVAAQAVAAVLAAAYLTLG